jgi:threonine/homoserine/homoserine lactone efflux protein
MLETLAAGAALGLTAGFSPGPLLALVVAQSLRHGLREGIKVALVPLITDAPIILVSLFLLSRLAGHDWALGLVSLAGAGVVGLLAYSSFRTRGLDLGPGPVPEAPHSVRSGVLVNLLSPHPYLFWMSVGAPAMLKGWEQSPWLGAGFVAVFYLCLVGAKLAVAVGAGISRRFLLGLGYMLVMRLLGLALIGFAALLARDGSRLLGLFPTP